MSLFRSVSCVGRLSKRLSTRVPEINLCGERGHPKVWPLSNSFGPKTLQRVRANVFGGFCCELCIWQYGVGSCSASRSSQRRWHKATATLTRSKLLEGECFRAWRTLWKTFWRIFWQVLVNYGGFCRRTCRWAFSAEIARWIFPQIVFLSGFCLEAPAIFLKTFPNPVKQGTCKIFSKNFSKRFPYIFSLLVGLLLFFGCAGLARQSYPPPPPIFQILGVAGRQLTRCIRATPRCCA